MKWARVDNGIVVEFTDVDPAGRFVQEIVDQFHTCSDDVEQGWTFENETFSKLVSPAQQIITPSTDPNTADMWQALLDLSAQVESLKGGN